MTTLIITSSPPYRRATFPGCIACYTQTYRSHWDYWHAGVKCSRLPGRKTIARKMNTSP